MKYSLEFSEESKKEIQKIKKSGDKILLKKIEILLAELEIHPGTGKPEQLKFQDSTTWSRRISSKHRLVYKIEEDRVMILILSVLGHYDDK